MRRPVSVKSDFGSVLILPELAASAAILPSALFGGIMLLEILYDPDIALNRWRWDCEVFAIAGRNRPAWNGASHFPQLMCVAGEIYVQQS